MQAKSERLSAEEMDDVRAKQVAYQYLCHLEETKLWLEKILKKKLPEVGFLEENLRNGVILARLGHFVTPEVVLLGSIYDPDQKRYEAAGLSFRHTDNINLWLRALQRSGFPRIFLPEVTDVYDRKNMPKVIYCIHGLSAHLFRMGLAPPMHDLFGKMEFTDDTITNVCNELRRTGVAMPAFHKISTLFAKEIDPEGTSLRSAISAVNDAIDKESCQMLLVALSEPALKLINLKRENLQVYMEIFSSAKKEKCEISVNKSLNGSYEADISDDILMQPEIQGYIHSVNLECFWQKLWASVQAKDMKMTFKIMDDDGDELVEDYVGRNSEYYVKSLENLTQTDANSLSPRELLKQMVQNGNYYAELNIQVENSLKRIHDVLIEGSSETLLKELKQSHLGVDKNLWDSAASLYCYELREHFEMTKSLTLPDIVNCIHSVNVIAAVTKAVDKCDVDAVWDSLLKLNKYLNGAINLPENVDSSLRRRYFDQLQSLRNEKLQMEVDLLTLEDIEDAIDTANSFVIDHFKNSTDTLYLTPKKIIKHLFAGLTVIQEINLAVKSGDGDNLSILLPKIFSEFHVNDLSLYMQYLNEKYEIKRRNEQELWESDIISISDEIRVLKEAFQRKLAFLNTVKTAVVSNNISKLEDLLQSENISVNNISELFEILKIDIKNFNYPCIEEEIYGKKIYFNMDECTMSLNVSDSTNIGFSTTDLMGAIETVNSTDILRNRVICSLIKIQALVRGFLLRNRIKGWKTSAIQIQRWWRAKKCLMNQASRVQTIVNEVLSPKKRKADGDISPAPSCKVLNETGCADAVEELIQRLRSDVIETIKKNHDLSKNVFEMDTKIGLLVRNRISIASLVAEKKKQKSAPPTQPTGIKSLSKQSMTLLDNYQKLFYLLQTRPEYLSRLITQSPSNLTIQSCILNLFNMGSSARDAFLLLRLFATALHEEVKEKFRKPTDAVTGNTLVLKLAVNFARQTGGQHPLQYILAPLINKVLEQSDILDTNPVDIYKRWLNENEVLSGCVSNLPRNVTQEIALSYPEVAQQLQHNIDSLKMWVNEFLNRLSENIRKFPYALKFIAKTLQSALRQKFSDITEKDTLKIVGHLIYYQYVNSAIVAPDVFQIISLPAHKPLRAEQRKNLASIAKILQFSASKNGFGEEASHLMQLNPFIIECHEIMKKMSRECCSVADPEEHYHVSQYSEALLLRRPRVYMTVSELCECHQMLIKLKSTIAPDPSDVIHDILHDIRDVPTPASLLGCAPEIAANMQAEKNLICLELNNEFMSEPEKKITVNLNELNIRREAQNKELHDLKLTLARLNEKTKHFEEQILYYEKYMETCLGNLTMKKKKNIRTVKYTGAQLLEKGVLANLDSVPSNQVKNVQFVISSTDRNGKFQVQCRFMGVEVETAQIDIQHLLSLQFDGCGVMNMFGKAEINVNLLIHLLNNKFIKNSGKDFKTKK